MKNLKHRFFALLMLALLLVSLLPPLKSSAAYGNGYSGGRAGDGVGIYAHGVDLSEWQGGEVDFFKIKEQGYSFVILRAGFSVHIDEYFERNYAAAKEAGLHVGVYLYSYADTVDEVLGEAEALKGWLSGKMLEYPVYYDMEEPDTHGKMSAAALTELSMAFLDSMAADGWLVGLYSCKSWLDNKLETDKICAQYECWMALYLSGGSYSTYDRYDEYCGMWQYSSTGRVDGVPGNVDMNIAFKDYPSICMQFGLNGYKASGETLELYGASEIPDVIACGESIPVNGQVISTEGDLSNVTAAVYDSSGNQITGRSAGPRTSSYDVSELAAGVKTESLPEGVYIYRVTATNSKRTRILSQKMFEITQTGIVGRNLSVPQDLKEGEVFRPEGEIIASTALQEVLILISDVNGNVVQKAADWPNSQTYQLNQLSSKLSTQTLQTGQFYYKVTARSQKGTQELVNEVFSVWVKNDPITINNFSLKSEYHLGEMDELSGQVTSANSLLRELTVTITDVNLDTVCCSATTQGAKEVNLEDLNPQLQLRLLSYGSYLCTITATNDAGPVTLAEKEFVVRPDGLSLCELAAPSVLYLGDSFVVSGAVASDDSAVTFVSITVTDEKQQVVLDAAAIPNVMVYDLSELGKALCFSTLKTGCYELRIRASNASVSKVLYKSTFQVTNSETALFWSTPFASCNGISFASYDSIDFSGTIESSGDLIQLVSAEIFSKDGALMNAAQTEPMDLSFDIDRFDGLLRISALYPGNYSLRITAICESGTFTMADEQFSVSECNHSNVRSGVVHEQRCDRIGAVGDSRCSSCGEKVQHGLVLSADEHQWNEDRCRYCGTKKMNTYTLYPTDALKQNGHYLIAYCDSGRWYALNHDGAAVLISEPDVDGSIRASAELLWTAAIRGGRVSFATSEGTMLQLDSNCLKVARGMSNARFTYAFSEKYCSLGLVEMQRYLSFGEAGFEIGALPIELQLFELN